MSSPHCLRPAQAVATKASYRLASQRRSVGSRQRRVHVSAASSGKEAVVVGGGPAGLASAMMLAKRGWSKVTVLESRDKVTGYDPSLGFVYMIDGRGQGSLREIDASIVDSLGERAAGKGLTTAINIYDPEGKHSTLSLQNKHMSYWIARYEFLAVLYDAMVRMFGSVVSLLPSTRCTDVRFKDGALTVQILDRNGETGTLTTDLVIGADGINSAVRKSLEKEEPERFGIEKRHSASAGLLYKVLSLPMDFPLPDGRTFPLYTEGQITLMALQGALKGSDTSLRLGFLPTNPDVEFCTANIIRYPSHKIWGMETGEELTDFLQKSFPQIPVKDILDKDEADRYATARPGSFPTPQYCRSLQKVLDTDDGHPKGILLLGDAAHAFPPDLGQGVNSALQDVKALGRALDKTEDDLSVALPKYEAERLPENIALIRLMQLGGPYQYKQNALKANLERLNLVFRLALNKLCPQLFDKQIFMMVTDPSATYQDILNRANRTTRNIYTTFGALAVVVAVAVRFLGG